MTSAQKAWPNAIFDTAFAATREARTSALVQKDSRATARHALKSTSALKELTIVTNKRNAPTRKEDLFALARTDSSALDRLVLMKMNAEIRLFVAVS